MTRQNWILPAIVLVVAGCSITVVGQLPSSGVASPSPTLAGPALGVANGLNIPVTLFTNGTEGIEVPAGTRIELRGAVLGPLPWKVEARAPSGRVLLELDVPAGSSISDTSGVGARADLACGRLDLYAGPPMLGPAFEPDPSKPCD